jgi:hypothetical protein
MTGDLFDTPTPPADTRPVLVGMNNPLHDNPRYALYPAPEGVTGHRMWTMLTELCGCRRQQYLDAFDRRNVLNSRVWDRRLARQEGPRLWRELAGRTVVLLGREVVAAVGLQQPMPLVWHGPDEWRTGAQPARWCYMPHPSGLNLWYNNGVCRVAAALRLEQLYEESRDGRGAQESVRGESGDGTPLRDEVEDLDAGEQEETDQSTLP